MSFRVCENGGFTLIEIVATVVIISLVAAVALPTYNDLSVEAKKSSCKGALSSLREGVSIWHVRRALESGGESWPDLETLATPGMVMAGAIPPNPFQGPDRARDSIVTGETKGVVVGERGGWAYNPETGEIWANTSTTTPGSGCSGQQDIGENLW